MKSLSYIDYREAVDIDEMVAKTGFWHAPPGSLQDWQVSRLGKSKVQPVHKSFFVMDQLSCVVTEMSDSKKGVTKTLKLANQLPKYRPSDTLRLLALPNLALRQQKIQDQNQ